LLSTKKPSFSLPTFYVLLCWYLYLFF
jgi:hypothetical protein